MKKLIIVLIVIGVLGLLAATCPNKQDHSDAVMKVLMEWRALLVRHLVRIWFLGLSING